ncbi:MAG: hypothetical protein KGQ66_10445 [Acidobacteriota bacterium]|nr:hypothetical protein [Acidobacteriota bacterium]
MHLNGIWLIPMAVTGIGAAALALVAAAVRRDVADLQRSLRPLRVPAGRRPRSVPPGSGSGRDR